MKRIAVYPGSFDPLTIGHLEIIKKAAKLFDELHVVIGIKNTKIDKSMFTLEQRLEMLQLVTKDIPNVILNTHEGLIVDYASKINAIALIRGIRNSRDFDYEITQYHFNHELNKNVETIILLPNAESLYISSSAVKELMYFNADYSKYVPKEIYEYIKNK